MLSMKKMILLSFVLGFLSVFVCLHAELQFSIADTLSLGGMTFGKTIQLSGNRYVSISTYSLSLYQVDSGSISLLDKEVCTSSFAWKAEPQLIGSRLHVLSDFGGVYVFDVSATALEYVGEIPLINIAGRDCRNMNMWLYGSTMVVSYLYGQNQQESDFHGYYDVYNISDIASPTLIASYDVPGVDNYLSNILFTGTAYYLVTAKGGIYFTEQLSQLEAVNVVPYLPSDESIMNSFIWNNSPYILTTGPFGGAMYKCSVQTGNTLAIDWMISLPFWYCFSIWMGTNQVIISGVNNDGVTIYGYSASDSIWTLQFQRDLSIGSLHETATGYIAFSSGSVKLYDSSLNQGQVLHEGPVYYLTNMLGRRFAIVTCYESGYVNKIYDLQTEAVSGYSSSIQYTIPNRSFAQNQILFNSAADYELFTFSESGSFQTSNFSLPSQASIIDYLGNRVLTVNFSENDKVFTVYDLMGNTLTQIATASSDMYFASTNLYDANHFVDTGYSDSSGGFVMVFYRINSNGSIEELQRFPISSAGRPYIMSDKISLGVQNSPIFDISDPDAPFQCSICTLPMVNNSNISFDGMDRYLVGPDMNRRWYLTNADLSHITSFQADNPYCIGRNKVLVAEGNSLIILQHPEPVDISDPLLPLLKPIVGMVYPNPFRASMALKVQIPQNSSTSVDIYNLKGQRVKSLHNGLAAKGELTLNWDATDSNNRPVASGIYLFNVQVGKYQETLKVIHLKQ